MRSHVSLLAWDGRCDCRCPVRLVEAKTRSLENERKELIVWDKDEHVEDTELCTNMSRTKEKYVQDSIEGNLCARIEEGVHAPLFNAEATVFHD